MTRTQPTATEVAEHMTINDAEAIAEAYLELGITASDDVADIAAEIEEAYAGHFVSDEEFAKEQADATTSLNTKEMQAWPHYCIDWEWAAREIMMDYSEEGGYYFRNI